MISADRAHELARNHHALIAWRNEALTIIRAAVANSPLGTPAATVAERVVTDLAQAGFRIVPDRRTAR